MNGLKYQVSSGILFPGRAVHEMRGVKQIFGGEMHHAMCFCSYVCLPLRTRTRTRISVLHLFPEVEYWLPGSHFDEVIIELISLLSLSPLLQ